MVLKETDKQLTKTVRMHHAGSTGSKSDYFAIRGTSTLPRLRD